LDREITKSKSELAIKVDKLTFAVLMMLNAMSDGKEIEGEKVVLVISKQLVKQIEAILTK
jgi:hypothetical protein